jgi:hypothetical protein
MATPEEKYNREVEFQGARLEVIPLYDSAVPGFVNKVPVLFQFVTGTDPLPQREPFSLAVVLDVSGSMQGAKLASCKAAILQLIDAAEDHDRLTLVTYSDRVSTKFENMRCGDRGARADMKAEVRAVTTEGTTNLYGGLLEGYRLLQQGKVEVLVEVTVSKAADVEKLGLRIVAGEGHRRVVGLVDDGFMAQWNRENPDQALLEGDLILECNGVGGDADRIRDAMQMPGGGDLRFQVKRATDTALPNKHIFLLSDGQVNAGPLQATPKILKAVAEWEEKVPILSYGIGNDFNEHLMSPLGQVHRGSHYFYITDAASIERLIAKGVRALTSSVARNVRLDVSPLSPGLLFPDHLINGVEFPLVRERSVIQYLVELEARPELPRVPVKEPDFEVVPAGGIGSAAFHFEPQARTTLSFEWAVTGFPLLERAQGRVELHVTTDRSFRQRQDGQVRTYLDVKHGCELRKSAGGSEEARRLCE